MSKHTACVITGASGYLGRAMVEEFSQDHEALLVLSSRRKMPWLESSPISSSGRVLILADVDLASVEGAKTLASKVNDFIRGPFHVINCVGKFTGYRPITEIGAGEALEILSSNYISVYNTAHELLPLLQRRGGGSFLAFTSHSRYQAYPNMAAFDSAKAAVEQLIRHIANEMSEHGVTANAFALATLATNDEFQLKPHGDHEHWLRPRDVSRVVRSLVDVPHKLLNGNIIHLYSHSQSYFHQSYFDRIKP